MEIWQTALIGGAIGAAVSLAMVYRPHPYAPKLHAILVAKGPLTIPELMTELGVKGFSEQGKVVTAVGQLVRKKLAVQHPLPPGTPQLQKIKVRKYAAA
jgi:hypothetical protein